MWDAPSSAAHTGSASLVPMMSSDLGPVRAPHDALTRADIAGLRALAQGLAPSEIARRYGASGVGPSRVLEQLEHAREALVQRALLHGRAPLASALAPGAPRARALAALNELERLGPPSPRPEQSVAGWFSPALAARLQRAGLHTVGDVVALCNRRGHTWWRWVPRVGPTAAQTIVRWLHANGGQLVAAGGTTIGAHVLRRGLVESTKVPVTTSFVPPLERMRIDVADLDGSRGINRGAGGPALHAHTDLQAAHVFLSRWPKLSHTFRAYRKEVERFIAWSIVERGKAMSSLLFEDVIAYRDFLADPQPRARWCGPAAPRSSPAWRPFAGPLSPRSQSYSLTVLASLFEFLVRQRYLAVNPFDGLPRRPSSGPRLSVDKALPLDTWHRFEAWLRDRARDSAEARVAWAVVLVLRDTGLRRHELAKARREHCMRDPSVANALWGELRVVGKGGKERDVPLSSAAVEVLRAHWRDRGEDFDAASTGPLLRPLSRPSTQTGRGAEARGAGYHPGALYSVVRRIGDAFARASDGDPEIRDQVAAVRPHALRHTMGVHATEAGVPLDVLQDIFGHASPATTSIYNRAPRKRRLREIGKLFTDSPS